MKNMNQPHNKQTGFTLIEALLALFVLTIGILGVAGMLLQGMRAGGVAMQRMVVVVKSQEIVERMRANVGYGTDTYLDTKISQRNNLIAYSGAVGVNNNCNSGVVCTPAQQAAHDLYMWRTELTALLPNVTGTVIAVNAAATPLSPYTVSITINWTERSENLSYNTTVRI